MDTHEYILYQWPSSEYSDSIYVRCTKIQRLLGYLNIPYKVAEISLPIGANEKVLSGKINPLLKKIPILKDENTYLEDTDRITDYLITTAGRDEFRTHHRRGEVPGPGYFLNHWVERWLVWLVIYGRWRREENFHRFTKTIGKPDQRLLLKSGMIYTRKRACEILNKTEVGSLSVKSYMEELRSGMYKLESILSNSPYLTGKYLAETDLGLFMCIQGLLDPSLEEESELVLQFDAICRWAKKVDEQTSTCHTRPLKLLYSGEYIKKEQTAESAEAVESERSLLIPRIEPQDSID